MLYNNKKTIILYRRAYNPIRNTNKIPLILMPCALVVNKDFALKEGTFADDFNLLNEKYLIVAVCLLKTRCFIPNMHILVYYETSSNSGYEIFKDAGQFFAENGFRPNYAITYDHDKVER